MSAKLMLNFACKWSTKYSKKPSYLNTSLFKRFYGHDLSSTPSSILCHKLTHRGLIRTSGRDTSDFLQGLITNDMRCLDVKCDIHSMFAMLLNVQGRILYDMIIYKDSKFEIPTYFIECETSVIPELIATMKKYKIRKKVDITDVSKEYSLWSFTSSNLSESGVPKFDVIKNKEGIVSVMSVDPRVKTFGTRMILPFGESGVYFFFLKRRYFVAIFKKILNFTFSFLHSITVYQAHIPQLKLLPNLDRFYY